MSDSDPLRPYLMAGWPKSDGRTFLAHAFAFFCMLEWGHSFEEMDAAFDPMAKCESLVRAQILGTVQNLGQVIQQGRIETYARPFGGGTPKLLPQKVWELDDFRWRFGSSAINPTDPFNQAAPLTHWIFVNTSEFDEVLGLVQDGTAKPQRSPAPFTHDREHSSSVWADDMRPNADRYLRKADVLKLVPWSRSTFDDRVRRGLFPASHDLGGGIVVWWESEVLAWMREKGGRPGL